VSIFPHGQIDDQLSQKVPILFRRAPFLGGQGDIGHPCRSTPTYARGELWRLTGCHVGLDSPNKDRHRVTQVDLLRHRKGVESADEELYRKHSDALIRFATGLVGPHDAPDVVSAAVLSCLTSATWSEIGNREPYLFRSVYNEAAMFRRSSLRRTSRERRAAQPEAMDTYEIRPEVLDAVKHLSVRQRAVIVLTYWEDLDPWAIANLLQISHGSVKRHLARGRSRLKEVLHVDQ
jgi:RNA polymerase sigma factor (sigma-70 family)